MHASAFEPRSNHDLAAGFDDTGTLQLPANRGGNLYLSAACTGTWTQTCDQGATQNAWALIQVWSAQLLLSTTAAPDASAPGGSLLTTRLKGP